MQHKGFSVIEFVVGICIIFCIAFTGWYIIHHQSKPIKNNPVSRARAVTALLTISNSGSTNFSGWTLTINTDGGGHLDCDSIPPKNTPCTTTTFVRGTFSVSALKRDLNNTNLSSYSDACEYSVSFGSIDTLTYSGKSTRGIDCYASTEKTLLAKDLSTILSKISSGT